MTTEAATYPGEGFWNRMAKRYARQPIADEAAYQRKLEVTREYFTPETKALELGCGTGSTALLHAPHVRHIEALDISAKMIEICREKAATQNVTNVTFSHSPIDGFEAPPASYDVVLALSILHLLADKETVIARVFEMLKPGGVFVTSTVCAGDSLKFRLVALLLPLGAVFGLLPRVKVFTADALERSMVDAGFEIDRRWRPGPNKAVFIVAKKRG